MTFTRQSSQDQDQDQDQCYKTKTKTTARKTKTKTKTEFDWSETGLATRPKSQTTSLKPRGVQLYYSIGFNVDREREIMCRPSV